MGQRSNWWYLAPILFGIVGGILGYFGIRRDDPKKAKNILIIGVLIWAVVVIPQLAFIATSPDILIGSPALSLLS